MCFIKLDITQRKNYKKIHELSEICRNILSSGFDSGFSADKVTFITHKTGFFNEKWELKIDKNRRKFHTDKFKFYDTMQKKICDVEAIIHTNNCKMKVLNVIILIQMIYPNIIRYD